MPRTCKGTQHLNKLNKSFNFHSNCPVIIFCNNVNSPKQSTVWEDEMCFFSTILQLRWGCSQGAAVNISHLCPQQLYVSLFSHPFCSWHSKMIQSISQGALLSSWPEIYTSRCLCCTGEECSPQNDYSLCFLVGYWIFLTMWVHLFEDGCKKHVWTTSCDPHMTNLLTSEEAYKQTNKNA